MIKIKVKKKKVKSLGKQKSSLSEASYIREEEDKTPLAID